MSNELLNIHPVLSEEDFYKLIGENELERGKEQPTIVLREDGIVFVVPAEYRAKKHDLVFSPSELWVLDRVMEPILDVGCGGGYHLAYLQEKGFHNIQGIDLFEYCVKTTRRKGIKAQQMDIFDESCGLDRKFRTILLMSNNIGIGANMEGAIKLLTRLQYLLLPNGEILGTTMDWTRFTQEADKRYYRYQEKIGKPGVIRLRFQYMDQISQWIEIWNASHEQLKQVAEKVGFEIAELKKFSHEQVLSFRLRLKT